GDETHGEYERERERVVRIAAADRERVQRTDEEACRHEISEPRPREEHDRPRAEICRDEEGADEVPGAVQRLAPTECRADELGTSADAVPEKTDRPHELERPPA